MKWMILSPFMQSMIYSIIVWTSFTSTTPNIQNMSFCMQSNKIFWKW